MTECLLNASSCKFWGLCNVLLASLCLTMSSEGRSNSTSIVTFGMVMLSPFFLVFSVLRRLDEELSLLRLLPCKRTGLGIVVEPMARLVLKILASFLNASVSLCRDNNINKIKTLYIRLYSWRKSKRMCLWSEQLSSSGTHQFLIKYLS